MYLNRIHTATFLPFRAYNTDNQLITDTSGCSQLKRIAFEKGAKLKIIPQSVFANLNSLTAIEIPASIELIEDGAFADCHSLTVITFEKNSNLKAIGNSAFDSD